MSDVPRVEARNPIWIGLVIGRTMVVQLTARGRDLQQRMAEVYSSVVDAEIVGQFTEQERACRTVEVLRSAIIRVHME